MSYKYGLNGNDLDWDAMMFLNNFVEEIEIAIYNGEVELDEDGYIVDSYYEGMMDGNPTMIYYSGKGIDIQELLAKGEKLDTVLDWYIVHDTNGNFVEFVGDVPDEYLREEYIKERNEAENY